MSNKRNKNARKKVVRKRAPAVPHRELLAPSGRPPTHGWTPPPEEDEPEPIQETVTVKEGGGAINTFRTRLTPGAGRDRDTLLTKRRSLGELSLWLGGACGLFWLFWKLIQTLNPPI